MAKTAKLTIKMKNQLDNNVNENFRIDKALADNGISSDTAVIIDTFSRGICGLTKNTYSDSIVTTEDSINEILAE